MWQAPITHPLSPFGDGEKHAVSVNDGRNARAVVTILTVRKDLNPCHVWDVLWRGRRARALRHGRRRCRGSEPDQRVWPHLCDAGRRVATSFVQLVSAIDAPRPSSQPLRLRLAGVRDRGPRGARARTAYAQTRQHAGRPSTDPPVHAKITNSLKCRARARPRCYDGDWCRAYRNSFWIKFEFLQIDDVLGVSIVVSI
eukprot:COSAG02_NODE_106_length_36326_cov_13.777266_28_plen_198_part_00